MSFLLYFDRDALILMPNANFQYLTDLFPYGIVDLQST